MWNHLRLGQLWTGELVNQRKSGEIYWEEAHIAPVKNRRGDVCNYVAVKLDITERKRTHERLDHLAHYDVLTNLPNRVLFFERVIQGISLAKRNKTTLALMYLDFDKFKPINDTYGHAVGDLVLQEAAMRMSGCLRESDTVGRIGGDEFVVLLLEIGSEENAFRMAEKIRIALNQPCLVAGETLSISSSIGVVLYPAHGHDGIELAKFADIAMYHAKAGGRDKVVIYHAGMDV
jgi:diguanylate cyclase (GGDEF)-like protein